MLAAAVFLAACTAGGASWSKAGVSGETMAVDVDECEFFGQTAALSAANQPTTTYAGVSSSGKVVTTTTPGAGALSYMAQGDAFARCMTARGYKRTSSP
jgi:hydrogenase maturation factor